MVLSDDAALLEIFHQPTLCNEEKQQNRQDIQQPGGILDGVKGEHGRIGDPVPAADILQHPRDVGAEKHPGQLTRDIRAAGMEIAGIIGIPVVHTNARESAVTSAGMALGLSLIHI